MQSAHDFSALESHCRTEKQSSFTHREGGNSCNLDTVYLNDEGQKW